VEHHAATVAAYRDRWAITDPTSPLGPPPDDPARQADHQRAQAALAGAHNLSRLNPQRPGCANCNSPAPGMRYDSNPSCVLLWLATARPRGRDRSPATDGDKAVPETAADYTAPPVPAGAGSPVST
jgi:hypothetical protein